MTSLPSCIQLTRSLVISGPAQSSIARVQRLTAAWWCQISFATAGPAARVYTYQLEADGEQESKRSESVPLKGRSVTITFSLSTYPKRTN